MDKLFSRKKICVSPFAVLLTLFLVISVSATEKEEEAEIKKKSRGISFTAKDRTFKGKVLEVAEQSKTTYIKYPDGFFAYVTWVIPPGSFVRGPVYNKKGEVIEKGELLVRCDSRYYSEKVKAAEGDLNAANGEMKSARANFKRCKNLFKKRSVSEREKDLAEAEFYKSLGGYKRAQAELELAKLNLGFCELRARFDGFVEKVFARPGDWSNVDYPVLKLLRLDPVIVKVEMDRELAKEVEDQKAAVTIKPFAYDIEVGAYNSRISLNEKGLTIPVNNFYIKNKIKDMPVIHTGSIMCVMSFYSVSNSKCLGVPWDCIHKDDVGHYVWLAVGQRECQPGKVIAGKFKVKKVRIKIGEKLRDSIFGAMIILLDKGGLQEHDVLLLKTPKGLIDGQTVAFSNRDCLFWPGDEVEVRVTRP